MTDPTTKEKDSDMPGVFPSPFKPQPATALDQLVISLVAAGHVRPGRNGLELTDKGREVLGPILTHRGDSLMPIDPAAVR